MRVILLVAALMGCGTSGSDVHDDAMCVGWTSGASGSSYEPPDGCDRACAMEPANQRTGSGDKCVVDGETIPTCAYFTFEGVKGCCQTVGPIARARIVFAECEAQ